VSLEDSSGTVLQEITTLAAKADTLTHAPGALVLSGEWKKDRLEAERQGPRGGKVTQTLSLADQGGTLVIETKMAAGDSGPAREFKRVYRKVTPS
jgi:hypothetical protein